MKKRSLKEIVEFVKFSFVGLTTFLLHLFLTVLLTEVFGFVYYTSYAIALALGWVYNFFLNMWFTFSAKGKLSRIAEKFSVVILVSTAMNWLLVFFLVEVFGLHYFLAILIVSILLSIIDFFAEEDWVFRIKKKIKKKR
jgi:putative flippase GtrA